MKRFTETTKWADPWFRRLPGPMKLFWLYLCDNCDQAGVWEVDLETAAHFIGEKLDARKVWQTFAERLEKVPNGHGEDSAERWRVLKFVLFQYPTLSEKCPPHAGVFKAIERHGLEQDAVRLGKPSTNLCLTFGKPLPKAQEEETDKEEEKATESEADKEADPAMAIYELYPRKAARGPSVIAIRKALMKTKPGELAEAVGAFAAAVATWPACDKPQFIPMPSTWFNQERWADDRGTWVRHANGHPSEPARLPKDLR